MAAASWSTITMARETKITALSIAAFGIGALLWTNAAFSTQPQIRLQPHAPAQVQAPAQHLDLRPPSHALEAENAAERSAGSFAAMTRSQNTAHEPAELPTLGSDGTHARPTVQEFVQRVHREGLPVARLFETKSALVHLGLSPRGKPGLWLVQKTR
jgi:hypothetical protein